MGTVYKQNFTKPLPLRAEFFTRKGQRFAKWTDAKGHKQTAKVTTNAAGVDRLIIEAATYTAKYRDGSGLVRSVATGCRDESAARSVLGDLERRAELVKAKVMTSAEDAVADHQGTPLAEHFDAYRDHLTAKGCVPRRVSMVRSRLTRIAAECGFGKLHDLSASALERWLVASTGKGVSAAARNGYREAAVGFGNWARRTRRLTLNPFTDVPIANVNADRRRQRRALTEPELVRLLAAASRRPLAEYGREAAKLPPDKCEGRRTWAKASLTIAAMDAAERRARVVLAKRPGLIAELEHVGRERALIYKSLLLTGLRKGELASLTVGQLDLDGPVAYAVLRAADEKNRQGSDIPLRADLAADLRGWIADRLETARAEARAKGEPIPVRLPADAPLFNVPTGLVRILDRDLSAAGIAKRDDRGRTVDVHAMRHTFGTHLSKGGTAPRIAQAAMRHSSIDLTMNVYTDPRLLDVVGALDSLPSLPLDGKPQAEGQRATGTDAASALTPTLTPTVDNSGVSRPSAGNPTDSDRDLADVLAAFTSAGFVERKTPLSTGDNGVQQKRVKGLEPSTFTLAT